MRRIDAHQHFWKLSRGDYGWLTSELAPIYRDFLPEDFAPFMAAHQIDATIAVQAAPSDAETDFLLSLAEEYPFIEGVVGWIDFGAGNAPERVAALACNPRLKGLRPMIQDLPDDEWMLRPDLAPAFRTLIDCELVFDALVTERHLPSLLGLTRRYPQMAVVIDHCAKPRIAAGAFDEWARAMRDLARGENVFCKLSGLVTEAGASFDEAIFRPYVDLVLETFGAQRLIWGSDWPVCTLAASYEHWCRLTDALLAGCPAKERAQILGGNAARIYGLY